MQKFSVAGFLSLLLVLYVWNPEFFERNLFLNEVLALSGLLLAVFVRAEGGFYSIKSYLLIFVMGLSVYFVVSLYLFENFYIYMRNMALIYSVFVYFVGYYCYRHIVGGRLSLLFLVPVHKVGVVASLGVFLAGFRSVSESKKVLLYCFILIVFSLLFGGSTSAFVAVTVFFLHFLGRRIFILGVVVFLCLLVVLLYGVHQDFVLGNTFHIDGFKALNVIYALDGNVTVRLLMWAKILFEFLPNNPFGLGFGTGFFDSEFIGYLNLLGQLEKDALLSYTLSPHNSYFYLVARMGWFSLFVFAFVFWFSFGVVSKCSPKFEPMLMYSVVGLLVASFFNVVLESPIHSGAYWGVLGLYHASRLYDEKG